MLTCGGVATPAGVTVDVLGPDLSTVGGVEVCTRQSVNYPGNHGKAGRALDIIWVEVRVSDWVEV